MLPPHLTAAVELSRGQLLDLMLDAEDHLRDLVRAVFSRERPDWEALIPRSIREGLEEARDAEASDPWAPKWRRDLLDFASLDQLVGTVSNQWKLFEPLLVDKQMMQVQLKQFRKYRNALAHGDRPGPDENVKIAVLIQDVETLVLGPKTAPPPVSAQLAVGPNEGFALAGKRVLWVDDRPQNNRTERRWLEEMWAEVIPVLSNAEAAEEARDRHPDLVISDIDRGEGEPGTQLALRLAEAGARAPIIFFVGTVRSGVPLPAGAIGITSDPAELFRLTLNTLLSERAGHR
jgi:CheY-like chemotaxis protein